MVILWNTWKKKTRSGACSTVSVVSRYLVRSAIPVKDAKHFTTNQSRSSRSNFDYSRPVYAKLVVNPIEIYIKTEDNTRKENSRGYSNLFEFIGIFHSFKLIRGD